LDDIANYLDAVIRGDLPVNHSISYVLQNAFNEAPRKELNTKLNDEGVILYTANLARCVTALHDLIENKVYLSFVKSISLTEIGL
jgi:26S proteasome regulatory subunit N8